MLTTSGYITAVQEERFRILTDDGRAFLLTLSRRAPLSGQDLCRLQQASTHVDVTYEGSPNLASSVALTVTSTPGARAPGT